LFSIRKRRSAQTGIGGTPCNANAILFVRVELLEFKAKLPRQGARWYLDEVFVSIKGKQFDTSGVPWTA
jgi:hypothetical protein